MRKEELQELFRRKIKGELRQYQSYMLRKEKREVYESAYEIACIRQIYGFLMEETGKLAEGFLETALVFPNLLLFLYDRWKKQEQTSTEGLTVSLRKELQKLDGHGKKKEVRAA